MAVAAVNLATRADQLANQLRESNPIPAQVRKYLRTLCEMAAKRSVDYDGFGQVAWAFRAIY